MIYDLLSSIKQMGSPVELAAANHVLKEGLYILIDVNGTETRYNELIIEKGGEYSGELYETFKSIDFLSGLIEMNKSVDDKKKIHSNNIYSLMFKYSDPKKTDKDNEKKGIVNIYDLANMEKHIDRYFDALEHWYENYKNILRNTSVKPVDKEKLKTNKTIFLNSIPVVIKLVEKHELKHGKYIKLFINEPILQYEDANKLYLFPKIFNNNESCVEINDEIFGLSNANMGLNVKKPFLSHITTQYKIPFRIPLSDALDANSLLLWLGSQNNQGKPQDSGYLPLENSDNYALLDEISKNTPAQFIHISRGKAGVEIDDYETLSYARKNLEKPLRLINYLNLPNYDSKVITEMRRFESLIDEILFNFCLVRNYYFNPVNKKNILSSKQAAIIQLYKGAFISYFRKSDRSAIQNVIDKVSIEMILEKLNQNDYPLVEYTSFAKALNLRFALLEYFEIGGKKELGSIIMNIYENLKEIIGNDNPEKPIVCESDEMFYFAVGQLARYLVGLSKAGKISYSFINPIIKAKNSTKIKREIAALIHKYGYDIKVYGGQYRSPFEIVQALVNSYDSDSQDNMVDLILAGFASPNLIRVKKDKEGQ